VRLEKRSVKLAETATIEQIVAQARRAGLRTYVELGGQSRWDLNPLAGNLQCVIVANAGLVIERECSSNTWAQWKIVGGSPRKQMKLFEGWATVVAASMRAAGA
jgi:hypothetical protein